MQASMTAFAETPRTQSSAAGFLLRAVLFLLGGAMVVAGFGIWLVPGSGYSADTLLIKLAVSLFMLIVGLCALVFARNKAS